MDESASKKTPAGITLVPQQTSNSKTFRLKLARSLQTQVEWVSQRQGVSVSYLITKAIEEKILRSRRTNPETAHESST